jgi:SurA-like protein
VRRALAVGAVLAAIVAGAAVYLAVRGGNGDPPVARVGGESITKSQLEAVVHHFRLQAEQEGNAFPPESTAAGRHARNSLLAVLVYRAELRQAAHRLGIQVPRVEVLRRLRSASGGEDAAPDAFAYGSAESQLLYERIYAKVTRGIKQAALRNAAMSQYVKRLQRETKVRYEPGYAPGP